MLKSALPSPAHPGHPQAEAWLMGFVRRLTERLARPGLLYADELSPHLRRDIGLEDRRR